MNKIGAYLCVVILSGSTATCRVDAQGISEGGFVQAGAAGLGAGLAASGKHGQVATRSYEAILQAKQAALLQTKAIEHYMSLGADYQAKKQLTNAEAAYKYVLQVTALRDGPGSANSVPALKQLVAISRAQNNLSEAIDYQHTVLAFAQAAKIPGDKLAVDAQLTLTALLVQKGDYAEAAPVIAVAAQTCESNVVPLPQRHAVRKTYAKVLRKLNRNSEAESIEAAELASETTTKPAVGVADSGDFTPAPATAVQAAQVNGAATRTSPGEISK